MIHLAPLIVLASSPSIDALRNDAPRVATVESSVAALQPGLGKKVEVATELKGLLVFLQTNEASPDVALSALAKALHASVEPTPQGLLLRRSPEDRKAADRARVAERSGWIQSRLDRVARYRSSRLKNRSPQEAVLDEVRAAAAVSEQIARGQRLSSAPFFATELLPSEDLLTSLVELVGKESIASVPIGRTKVWDDRPAAGSSLLPSHEKASAAYEAQMNLLRGTPISKEDAARMERLGMGSFFKDWRGETLAPGRLRLQVRSEETMVFVTLEGFDNSGALQTMASLAALPGEVWRSHVAIAQEAMARPQPGWVKLSQASVDALSAQPPTIVGKGRKALPWFASPEQREPLNLFAAEALGLLAARTPKRCFAAQVADGVWNDVRLSVSGERLSLAAFEAMLKEWTLYERVEGEGFVVWRPRGSQGAECNVDRKVLGQFARSVLGTGRLDLRAVSIYHCRVGPAMTDVANYWKQALRLSPEVSTFSGDASHSFYRMLGSVSNAQWNALTSGAPLSVGSLGVSRLFAEVLAEDRTPVSASGPMPDLLRHAGESFPSGGIEKTLVQAPLSRKVVVGVIGPNSDGQAQWRSNAPLPEPLEIGVDDRREALASMTRASYEKWIAPYRLQMGYQEETTIAIRFPNGLAQIAVFRDPIATTTSLAPYAKLSKDVRDALWASARQFASNPPTERKASVTG